MEINKCNISYKWALRAEIIWSSQYVRLFFWQNPASLYDKRAKIRGRKRMYLNKVKIFIWKVYSQNYTTWGKTQSISTTIWNKATVTWRLFNIVIAQAIRLEGYERDTNKAKRSQGPLNCGWYNSLYKILWRLVQTLKADIHFQQSNRLQNEHVKSAVSLYIKV